MHKAVVLVGAARAADRAIVKRMVNAQVGRIDVREILFWFALIVIPVGTCVVWYLHAKAAKRPLFDLAVGLLLAPFVGLILAAVTIGIFGGILFPKETVPAAVASSEKTNTPPPVAWTSDEARHQSSLILQAIKQGEADLKIGIETGDRDGIFQHIQAPFAHTLRGWNEQRLELHNEAANAFEACHFAAGDFQMYATTFTDEDSIDNRKKRNDRNEMYQQELSDCRKVLGNK